MVRFKGMLFGVVVMSAALVAAQPCHENSACFEGYFCDTFSGFICRPCLSCKDLKRQEPLLKKSCVESIKECGPCLKDLVDSSAGDLTCVSRAEGEAPAADNSATLWIVAGIVIGIFVVVVGVVVIIYMFRNSSTIKFHLDTNIGARLPTHVVATAPEFPPPYSPTNAPDLPRPGEDTERPLIKPYQPPYPERESQDHTNVSIFNPPSYVRLNSLPGTPHEPDIYDVNDNYSLPVPDEDTTPSAWTPGTNYTVSTGDPAVSGAAGSAQPLEGDFSAALAVARNTELIQPPQVTLRMQPVNTNDEPMNGDEAHAHHNTHGGASARTQGNGNYNVMNVNQIITIIKPPLDKQRSF